MSESKFRWQRNDKGGLTLQQWFPKRTHTYAQTAIPYTTGNYWDSCADVFKAKQGNRYVVRVLRHRRLSSGFDQYTAHTLREAMRLAKFLVGVNHESNL